MPPFYSLISHIKEMGNTICDLVLKLRIVRLYKSYVYGSSNQVSSYELVCHDCSGTRIHGTTRSVDLEHFKVKFVVGGHIWFYVFHSATK